MTTENLKGFEELKAAIGAWTNEDTRLLTKELIIKDHCTPRLPDSEAQEVSIYKNDELLSQSTIVKIPFKAHGRDLNAQIVYRENETSERAVATVAGPASVLEKPMGILEKNARYQAIVENLEERGYTVKEESAHVVKIYTPAGYASVPSCIEDEVWNTSIITVKATKGDQVKITKAFICIDKGKVLEVTDFWCEITCKSLCYLGAGGLCCYFVGCNPYCIFLFQNFGCGAACDYIC